MQFGKKQKLDSVMRISTVHKVSDFRDTQIQDPKNDSNASISYSSRLEQPQTVSLSVAQVKSELQSAIAQLFPYEQQQLAKKFCQGLPQEELAQLQLLNHHPADMTTEEISEIIAHAYRTNPNLFQEILAQQPKLIHLLSNHFVSAILGIMAAKWLNSSIKKMNII